MDLNKMDIDYQFDFYLKKVKLDPSKMSHTQYSEIKQAFIAGITQMMVMNVEIGSSLPSQSQDAIAKIWNQCSSYWNKQLTDIQKRQN